MTDEELDRETERLFAAARREKPAGALRERVMRGVTRGERARLRQKRVATFAWAAVAAGVGGLVWLTATAERPAPNVGTEPEQAEALRSASGAPSARALPSASAMPITPVPSASAAQRTTVPSPTLVPREATRRITTPAPPASSSPPALAPSAFETPPPVSTPDLSKAMEERK